MSPPRPGAGTSGREGEEGFALLMVLFFLMAVTAIIAPLVLGARTDFVVASNRLQQDRLEALADGLLTALARDLAAPPLEPRNEGIEVQSQPLRCQSGLYRIEARIQDQRGLIGINNANPELLAAGFEALDFPSGDVRELVEAVIAYRTPPPGEGGPDPDQAPQPPAAGPTAGAEDRVRGGLKLKPFEAVEELYDFTGFRGKPVRTLAEIFSVRNTADTVVGPRLSTRLSRVLPRSPSPRFPFILGQEEDGAKTYRVDVEIRSRDGRLAGYSGGMVMASESETGDFQISERVANPEFLPDTQGDFSGAIDCSSIFGAGVASELASEP